MGWRGLRALDLGQNLEGAGAQAPESGRGKGAGTRGCGTGSGGGLRPGSEGEGIWAPGPPALTLLRSQQHPGGALAPLAWVCSRPHCSCSAFPPPQLPALGGGQEKARGNPAGRAGRGRPVRGPGLEEETWVALALPHSLNLDHTAARWALPGPTGAWFQPLLPPLGDRPHTSPLRGATHC